MSIPRALNGKWLTNALLGLLSFICFWGFNRIVSSWDELKLDTQTNKADIAANKADVSLLRKDVDANSRKNNDQQVDIDLFKKELPDIRADLKILQRNERVAMQASKPDTPLFSKAPGLWANNDTGGRHPESRKWFPLAVFFDERSKLRTAGWFHYSRR